MNDREHELSPELERRWREWAETEPSLDEQQLKRNLMVRISNRPSHRRRQLVFVAAAASILAVLIGFETTRQSRGPVVAEDPTVIHETGANVILVLREGAQPIYVVTESSSKDIGVE